MRVTRTLPLFVTVFLSFSPPVTAQDEAPTNPDPASVVVDQRSPALAAILDILLPTAGYAYAGNWKRGLPSAGVRLVGIVLTAEHIVGTPLGGGIDCEASCVIGQLLLVGGTIWAGWDAAATARRANERARERALGLILVPSGSGGMRVGLRLVTPF